MEQKELKIVAPEGYEIDREHSTLDKIVFKKIDSTSISGYYFCGGFIGYAPSLQNIPCNYNVFPSEELLKHTIATARIYQILENDPRFGGVIDCGKGLIPFPCIYRYKGNVTTGWVSFNYKYQPDAILFHTIEQRDLFYEENGQLLKEYFMIK